MAIKLKIIMGSFIFSSWPEHSDRKKQLQYSQPGGLRALTHLQLDPLNLSVGTKQQQYRDIFLTREQQTPKVDGMKGGTSRDTIPNSSL